MRRHHPSTRDAPNKPKIKQGQTNGPIKPNRSDKSEVPKPIKSVGLPQSPVDSVPTHERLLATFKDLGYVPGSSFWTTKPYPKPEDLKKLCRPELVPVWEHLMRHVKPKNKIESFRKYKAAQALKDERSTLSLLKREQDDLEAEIKYTNKEIEELERECNEIQDNIKVKDLECITMKRTKEEHLVKTEVFRMKTGGLLHKTYVSQAVNDELNLVKLYTRESDVGGDAATTSSSDDVPPSLDYLRDLMKSVQKIHDKYYSLLSTRQEGEQVSVSNDLEELLATINDTVNVYCVKELWQALTSLQRENKKKIEDLVDIDWEKEEQGQKNSPSSPNITALELSSLVLAAKLDVENYKSLCQTHDDALNAKKREYVDLVVEQLNYSNVVRYVNVTTQSQDATTALVEEWFDAKIAAEQNRLRLEKLKEINRTLKKGMPDVGKLNEDLEALKLRLEKGKEELRAHQQRINHNLGCLAASTNKLDACYRQCAAAVNDACSLHDDIDATRDTFRDAGGSVSDAVKEFAATPLDAMDFVVGADGKRIPRHNMLINYARVLPLLPTTTTTLADKLRLLDGAPRGCVGDLVVNLYRMRQYDRQLAWALEARAEPYEIPDYEVAALTASTERQRAGMRRELDDMRRKVARLAHLVRVKVPETMGYVRDRPLEKLMNEDT